MKKYIVGLFDNRMDAEAAVQQLNARNLPDTDFGLFARDEDFREGLDASSEKSGVAKSAGYGAAAGGAAGIFVGIVAGASLFMIPGLGQILGVGTLAAALWTTLVSTGFGAASGAFMGALMGYGATEEDAHFYMEGIQRGGVLAVVHAPEEHTVEIADILYANHVVNVEARREEWKAQGWDSYSEHTGMDGRPPIVE
ncbi:MAG: hypothetical protein KF893_08150 [Caldilineaceae bacterium]|nr:hypothetical protein [Caldilineaceae bacterium]